MDQKQYRRYLLAAILLVGLLPVLGYYGARFIPNPDFGMFIGKENWEAKKLIYVQSWQYYLRLAIGIVSMQTACTAGMLLSFVVVLRGGFVKALPFLGLLLAGPLASMLLPDVLHPAEVTGPVFVGLYWYQNIPFYLKFVPIGILPFAGVLIACFVGTHLRKGHASEWKQFLWMTAIAFLFPVVLGLALIGIERYWIPGVYYTMWYSTMVLWTGVQALLATATYLVGWKRIFRQTIPTKQA